MVSITPIPNAPQTTSLNGNEIVPGVQAGTNVKIPVSQIVALTIQEIGGVDPGVLSFDGRVGIVTLLAADVTGVGGALLASPAFTGAPTAPTASPGTNTTQLATTAFSTGGIATAVAPLAPLASPSLTGIPTAPTASPGTNTTQIASTAFATGGIATAVAPLAPTASPALTGTPTAPTAALNTNTTQIANTAYVQGQASTTTPLVNGTAAVGTGTTWARSDHVHPSDTSRVAIAGGAAAVMTGSFTPASVAGIVGTITNDSAAAGSIGEYISSYQASGVSLSTTTPTTITSISLTAGDWDVEGCVNVVPPASTMQIIIAGISTTPATLPTGTFSGLSEISHSTGFLATVSLPTGSTRISIASTTTVYLVAEVGLSSGSATGGGSISARRRR
jgi:hypothetical protein